MPRQRNLIGDSDELASAFHLSNCPRVRQRLIAVQFALAGESTTEEIAGKVGRSASFVSRWIAVYRREGIDGLKAKRHNADKIRVVPIPIVDALRAGIRDGQWETGTAAMDWLKRRHQLTFSKPTFYYWWRKLHKEEVQPLPSTRLKDANSNQLGAWKPKRSERAGAADRGATYYYQGTNSTH